MIANHSQAGVRWQEFPYSPLNPLGFNSIHQLYELGVFKGHFVASNLFGREFHRQRNQHLFWQVFGNILLESPQNKRMNSDALTLIPRHEQRSNQLGFPFRNPSRNRPFEPRYPGMTKSKRDHNSSRLFWMGVPVKASLRWPLIVLMA